MLWHAAVLGVVKGTTTTGSAQWQVAHMHALHHVGSLCNSHVHYLHTKEGFFYTGRFQVADPPLELQGCQFPGTIRVDEVQFRILFFEKRVKHKGRN
jgi:hypothetical protein